MLRPFADWLAATPLSQQFQNHLWVVPTSQAIHILCNGSCADSTT